MKRKGTDLVVSSLYVALGVAFAMMGTLALKCGYVILGGILSFFGIINLSKRKRGGGLLYLVMGVALTLCAFTPLFRYFVVAFGMLTVVNGLVCIFQRNGDRHIGRSGGCWDIVSSICKNRNLVADRIE